MRNFPITKGFPKGYHNVEVHEGGCKDGVWLIGGSVTSANILGFEAGTTGYRGGDSGHGGRTFFSIFDLSGTDIRATTDYDGGALSVEMGGDCELETIVAALRSIALILEASASGGTKCTGAEQIRALMDGENEGAFEYRKVAALESIASRLRLMALAKYPGA